MNEDRYIQLGHRFKVEKTPDHAIIDTSPKMFDDENKALFLLIYLASVRTVGTKS